MAFGTVHRSKPMEWKENKLDFFLRLPEMRLLSKLNWFIQKHLQKHTEKALSKNETFIRQRKDLRETWALRPFLKRGNPPRNGLAGLSDSSVYTALTCGDWQPLLPATNRSALNGGCYLRI